MTQTYVRLRPEYEKAVLQGQPKNDQIIISEKQKLTEI